jgi:hypothetical protein
VTHIGVGEAADDSANLDLEFEAGHPTADAHHGSLPKTLRCLTGCTGSRVVFGVFAHVVDLP